MAGLILESVDKFSSMYDIVCLISENAVTVDELALSLRIPQEAATTIVNFLVEEGILKSRVINEELRLTTNGLGFLQEFAGLRKFLG